MLLLTCRFRICAKLSGFPLDAMTAFEDQADFSKSDSVNHLPRLKPEAQK